MTPPKTVLLVAGAVIVLLAAWLMATIYTGDPARSCLAMYRTARTAADSARVDSTIPHGPRNQQDPHSCRFMRLSARWP